MNVGIDYWNTISQAPDTFRTLCRSLVETGHKVYIITAVGNRRKHTVLGEIKALNIPNSGVEMLVFKHPGEAPALKVECARRLGINVFIDDRLDTCEALKAAGILALNILR